MQRDLDVIDGEVVGCAFPEEEGPKGGVEALFGQCLEPGLLDV